VVDGSILDQSPYDGFGRANEVSHDLVVSVGLNSQLVDSRGIIEYDLTQIDRRKRVLSAVLRIRSFGGTVLSGPLPVQVMGYRADGTLQPGDFNKGHTIAVYQESSRPSHTIEVDVTQFVRRAAKKKFHYVGFNLRTNVQGLSRSYGSLDINEPLELVVVQ
jgi:hypothetical protein